MQLTRPSIEDRHDERGQWVIVRVDNSLKKAAWAVLVLVGAGAIATQFPWAALTSTNPFERIFFYCVATLFIAVVAFCVPNTDNAANKNPVNSEPESPRKIDAGLKL